MTRFGLIAILAAVLAAPLRAQTAAQQPRLRPPPIERRRRRPPVQPRSRRRGPTSCAENTAAIAPTTICSSIISMCASTRSKKFISGKNTIRFRMLKDDTRIQLDLYANLDVDKILLGDTPLKYERELNTVFVDFPETLKAGRDYAIDFYYSGMPKETGPLRRLRLPQGSAGPRLDLHRLRGRGRQHLVAEQRSVARRSRVDGDQRRRSPMTSSTFRMASSLARPIWATATRAGIGWFSIQSTTTASRSTSGTMNTCRIVSAILPLDFYALPEDLEQAKKQFAQAKADARGLQHYFGEYPFKKDGYKLIQAPYSGMEHQSAVTYGNHFANGYLERDWTGVGISPQFDFIIIHESGHEWFGNSVTAADVSDMWIHEGWTTYLEVPLRGIYVRQRRWLEIHERLQVESSQPRADHLCRVDQSPNRRRTCTSKARCS